MKNTKIIKLMTFFIVFFSVVFIITIFNNSRNENNVINQIIEADPDVKIKNEVIISNETKELVDNTIEIVKKGEDISTTEVIKSSEDEETEITDEGALETDAVIEQENISYNGDSTSNGLSLLGAYQGLTYYSQADSRWANLMYSSVGDKTQTMKSSACGPTSAAMVVSSSKGTILPTTMGQLSVNNGYRTANNGTAWSYYSFVADYFNFNEYYSTSDFNTMLSYLKTDKDNDGTADYFVIASCGSGLFTTGGHYIVLVADNGGTISVYDPYLYSGKFNTASRRNADVVVSGNTAYVSESSFKAYANYKNFWIYSNDKGQGNPNTNNTNTIPVTHTKYVATQSLNLNVRTQPNGSILTTLRKGTKVTVSEISGSWSKITSPVVGWVSTAYLSSTPVITNNTSNSSTTNNVSYTTSVGSYYRFKTNTNIYYSSSMKGTYYTYLPQTQIKVLSHVTSNIDRVQVVKTGRIGYCYTSTYGSTTTNAFLTNSNNKYFTTTGKYYRLKYQTNMYSKGNLTGTRYNYLPQTQIKVISHYSSNVDYVYVIKTHRYAYCRISTFN